MKKKLLILSALLYSMVVWSQIPSYYEGVDWSKTGDDLKNELANLITLTHHTNLSYTPGVWEALKQTDLDPENVNNVLLVYGYSDTDNNTLTDRTRSKDLNGGNTGEWNREHVYPKSLGTPNLGTEGPGADAHHIRSSDVSFNALRSNLPYEDADGVARKISNSWYPGDEWKGDIARMLMYVYLRYGDRCLPSRVAVSSNSYHADMSDIFLEWNAEDPVSQYELNRNTLLETIQGNRNPFIDNPSLATDIWGGPQAQDLFEGQTTTGIAKPSGLMATAVSESQIDLTAAANSSNDLIMVAYTVNEASFGTPVATYTVGDTITGGGTVLFIGSASDLPNHLNLEANTTYSYKAWSFKNGEYSSTGVTSNATTEEEIMITPTDGILFSQGFEQSTDDTWNYTLSASACNSGGNDVWDVVSSVGTINEAATGTQFFGIRDLDGDCGTSDGATMTFDKITIANYDEVTLRFSINVVGYDVSNGDIISYELFYDDVSQGTSMITNTSSYSTTGWETITQTIPDTVNSIQLAITVKQNGGSDYAGLDDITLSGTSKGTTPSLMINEVDADTPGTDTMEFVELFDGGSGNTSLDGLVLVLYNGSNDQSYAAYDLDGYSTNAQGYFVAGNQNVPNVNLVFSSNGLQNGADAVALYQGDATDFPNGSMITTDNIIDALVYDTSDADDAELLVLLHEGQNQINENENGDKENQSVQRIPNGEGGVRNTTAYASATPTPGTKNGIVISGRSLSEALTFSSSNDVIAKEVKTQVYPSPAVDYIHIVNQAPQQRTGSYEYQIYDIYGRLVSKGSTDKSINVMTLKTGVYLLKVSDGSTHKFIKK